MSKYTCSIKRKSRLTLEDFRTAYYEKHGDTYDYAMLPLDIKSSTKITIICRNHGPFVQTAYNHKNDGCPKCKSERYSKNFKQDSTRLAWLNANSNKQRLTDEEFILRATIIHKGKYDYSLVKYINYSTPVTIICPIHGSFLQNPREHLSNKCGCQKCGIKYGHKQNAWLDSLGLPNDTTHRQVKLNLINGSYIFADGFDPVTNTVYEFWGDYHHGNPNKRKTLIHISGKTMDELYELTCKKIQLIKDSGFKLIDIWESDWEG